jgi:hypothetical protein
MVICGRTDLSAADLASEPVSFHPFVRRVPNLILHFLSLDDEKQCMLLVMRVLSIVPLNSRVSQFRRVMGESCCFPRSYRYVC